jgi:hypothetical protein
MMRKSLLIGITAFAWLAIGACDNGGDGTLVPGQTDFVSEDPNQHSNDDRNNWASPGAGELDSSKGGAAPPGAPPQGRTGEVEEADIYRVDNNRLFYLNTYRGFIIYDVNDSKKPKLISRLPVYGYPIEMFVSGTTVYALLRDSLYLTQSKGKLEFQRHNVSQLVAIDISDIKNPKVLKKVDIKGKLREGVSRKIEDTIYVVSYIPQYYYWGWGYNQNKEEEQAWVYSFNVKNPKAPQLVQKLKIFEGGSYKIKDEKTGTYLRRYFSNVSISATSNTLMVVENWRKYGWVKGSQYQCSSSVSLQQAVVSLIDISDPSGKINVHAKFETYGQLSDQFKQTYIYDKATGKATYYGIFARREWNNINCSGTSVTQNTLEAWDVTNGASPVKVDSLAFGKPNETVRGSAFDRDRKVVYAITAERIDPLYAISFADPKNLKVLSEIDGLSGDMNVFRLVEGGKFLLGIGRDNSQVCDGFGQPGTTWRSSGVAVSVIDVRDLAKIRLVQRSCVAVQNAEWVGSALNWNRDQAHKMIGMHSDSRANVITVPVYYYKKHDPNSGWWWYQRETAVGLMTWDTKAYDDTKDHTQQKVLSNFGTLIHAKGEVKRSIVFTHKGAKDRRMVINLSDTHLSVFDIDDLNKPVEEAVVEVAPYYQQVFRFGNYMVEHIGPRSYYWDYWGDSSEGAKSEFRVKAIGSDKLEDSKVVASFNVGQVHRVIKHGSKLVLFRYLPIDPNSKTSYYGYRESEALIYDLTTPTAPTKIGQVKLPTNVMPYYWYWCGDFGYWGGYWFDYSSNFTAIDGGVVFLSYHYDPALKTSKRQLVYLDLAKAYAPKVHKYTLTSATGWSFINVVPDGTDSSSFYLNYRTYLGKTTKPGGQTLYKYKYFAQHWKGSTGGKAGLQGGAAINLPGRLIRAFKGSWGNTMLLTHDYFYIKHPIPGKTYHQYQSHFRLNLLQRTTLLGQPVASLLDSRVFSSFYLKDLVVNGDKLVINARRDYYYQQQNNLDWHDLSDHLIVLDVSAGTLKETYSEPTGTYRVNLMGVHQGRLFVNLPGDGILVVDMSQPGKMIGQQFLRTLGWATHLEFSADKLYVAAGHFGIYEMKLKGPVVIPSI